MLSIIGYIVNIAPSWTFFRHGFTQIYTVFVYLDNPVILSENSFLRVFVAILTNKKGLSEFAALKGP